MKENNARITPRMRTCLFQSMRALAVLAVSVLSLDAHAQTQAQTTAPGMSGIDQFVLQPVRIGGTAGTTTSPCALARGEIDSAVLRILKGLSLPAYSLIEAANRPPSAKQVELVPEIVTTTIQAQNSTSLPIIYCANWVSLTAQGRYSLTIPPIEVARALTVDYWRAGIMTNNRDNVQTKAVLDSLEKLSRQFYTQYTIDQPPDFSGKLK